MAQFDKTAVLGAGVIGASWSALFLAAGKDVCVFDVSETVEEDVNSYAENAWPTLEQIGLAVEGRRGSLSFAKTPEDAVQDADFVQENVPERLPIKLDLYQRIEPHLKPTAVVSSSASGLMVKEMQAGWKNPARFILGHPFNPPHLVPLVEILGNDKTDPNTLVDAEAFYREVGKVTIRVNKEVPGHVANRLQAALWREAIHLVNEGVASVEDVDTAVWAGPGLRWGAMGPHMLFSLGAGAGGLEEFCNRYADSFHRWWDDLGEPRITPEVAEKLAQGVAEEAKGRGVEALGAKRDALVVAHLKAVKDLR